jgi:dual specificity tyrosine-phosphorylation-regulated kinase 2/3/4
VSQFLQKNLHLLTPFEQREILGYHTIHFIGEKSNKLRPGHNQATNYGFDDDRGDYRIVIGDHIAYRFEVQAILGKGSFGCVVRAYDHKVGETVALKIIRNKPRFT